MADFFRGGVALLDQELAQAQLDRLSRAHRLILGAETFLKLSRGDGPVIHQDAAEDGVSGRDRSPDDPRRLLLEAGQLIAR